MLPDDVEGCPLHGVIMAGGQGSRLRPLTLTRPKPMVEVLGRPVIDFVKDAMVDAGVDHLVVTTGYRGEQLSAHVAGWAENASINARINQEAVPMGTAGSVRLLLDELNETFVVGSGDAVASFDIQALLQAHKDNGAKVTMALWEVEDPTEFGIVGLSQHHNGELDGDLREGFIRQFKEKPTPEEAFSNVINAGLYIIEPEVLALVPEGEKFDFSKQLFPLVLEMGWPMYAQTIDGVWFDVGHPFELIRAQHALIEGRETLPFPHPAGTFTAEGSFFAEDVDLHQNSVGSVISKEVHIHSTAEVFNSLVMGGCHIEENVVIKDSILGRNVRICSGSVLHNAVIGDNMIIESDRKVIDSRIPNIE